MEEELIPTRTSVSGKLLGLSIRKLNGSRTFLNTPPKRTKWLRDVKLNVLEWLVRALTLSQLKDCLCVQSQ